MATPQLRPIRTCMEKYLLYETASFYYLVGCDAMETYFHVLKLNRCVAKPRSLDDILTEDPVIYNKDDLKLVLEMIHEGNRSTGGLSRVTVAYGLVGFVRFLDCYYFTLVTQKKKVGCIGSNFIYAVKAAEVFAIRPRENTKDELSITKLWRSVNKKLTKTNADQAESRYMGLFQFIDISKDFFFSYTYDLTHSLQHNFVMSSSGAFPPPPFREMYEWNKYQTDDIRAVLGDVSACLWSLPLIHGSFQQRRFSLFGRTLDMVLIARRSRHYAGTRYLKRGVSVHGKVANDCEMEQIIQLDSGLQAQFASYVQTRGSIPTYWYQETSVTNPKPPILVDRIDPNYLATQEHFADLTRRYSLPIIVLDLVKQHERRRRESIVGREFRLAVEHINISIPPEHKIRYIALDFSRMSKNKGGAGGKDAKGAATGKEWSRIESSLGKEMEQNMRRAEVGPVVTEPSQADDGDDDEVTEGQLSPTAEEVIVGRVDVLRELEDISSWTLSETALFSSTVRHIDSLDMLKEGHIDAARQRGYIEQRGVLRTNCIDCLDRTNVAQFAMGVRFLSAALRSLGVLDSHTLDPSNAMLLGLMDMFSDMGDRLALQYGGSEAHKKVSKGAGKTKQGEFLTSIKRYYSNSFTDRVKQDAMNLFLGYFQPSLHDYALWDLETDYFLHNRLLHPPRPDVDAILLTSSPLFSVASRGASDDSVGSLGRRSLADGRPTLIDLHEAERLFIESNKTETGEALDTPDVAAAMTRYFYRSTADEIVVKSRIAAIERIKRRLVDKKQLVLEAEELWWHKALMDFENERLWMKLPYPKDGVQSISYFEAFHQPHNLTSFDDELCHEFQYPIDATIFAAPKTEASGYWNRRRESHKAVTDSPSRDEDDVDEVNDEGTIGSARENAAIASEFEFFSFAKSLGARARTMVGDLLKPSDGESNTLSKNPSRDDFIGEKVPERPKARNDLMYSTGSGIFEKAPYYQYGLYCDIGQHPEVFIDDNYGTRPTEFDHAMSTCTIHEDDVRGMEKLARDCYIGNTIMSGPHHGISQMESACMLTKKVEEVMAYIEPILQSCAYAEDEDDQADDDMPEILKATLTPKVSNRDFCSLDVPYAAKAKIENIISFSVYDSESGLEEDLLGRANRYLYDQALCVREVDYGRLSKRLGSLTTEGDIIKYMSYVDKESVAADMDIITFMASDRASSKPFQHIERNFAAIRGIKRRLDESKANIISDLETSNGIGQTEEDGNFSRLRVTQTSSTDDHLYSEYVSATNEEYFGFVQTGPDAYTKISNPHFVCNQRAAASYANYRKTVAV